MKKITLLLLFLYSLSGYCQFPENFEGPYEPTTGLPAGWNQYQNGFGPGQFWKVASPSGTCQGTTSAFVDRESIGAGNTSEDYLVTPQFTVPADGQLRFLSKQRLAGNQGTRYQIKISENPVQSALGSYTLVQEYDEDQMNADASICQQQKLSIASYAGKQVYLAFVRISAQPTNAITGDSWYVDNVNVVSQCFDPSLGIATNITSTTAQLSWTDPKGSLWEIELVPEGSIASGNPNYTNITSKTFNVANLKPGINYCYYVRSVCTGSSSEWAGPFCFDTYPLGTFCAEPIAVGTLPFQTAANTGEFSDFVDGPQGSNCGANPSSQDFLAGYDVFYSYTATETGNISVKMIPTDFNSSLFIYGSCPIGGNCLAGQADLSSSTRLINNFPVVAGTTYTIVISSSSITPKFGYTLVIQREACSAPVGNIPTGSDLTSTSAKLTWSNTGATEYEVALQPLGSSIPTVPGTKATTNSLTVTLTPGTKYQYYVRAKCPAGDFSSWAGPYPFNSLVCEPADMCNYTFRLNDSANNGWGGATMQIIQSGIVMGEIGSTFTSGGGPVNLNIALCKNKVFELFWNNAGTNPDQCIVAIINNFNQTIFTKPAGVSSPGQVVYSDAVNCDTPVCTIVPTNLTATSITSTTASLGWTAPATTKWDIYVVLAGSPPPNATTQPTYSGVTQNPFTATGLLQETNYTFYVRTVCSPVQPDWSAGFNFTTTATCPKPKNLTVTAVTTTGATFGWDNGTPTDTAWEILLVKADPANDYGTPSLPATTPILKPGDKLYTVNTKPFSTNDLTPATIYYYYIRTNCGTEKSSWAGPFTSPTYNKGFNTDRCATSSDRCIYKIVLTDTGGNGWDGGRMEIRQNGIPVAPSPFGSSITGAGPTIINVQLCTNVPFDLKWTIAGDHPEEIGVSIQNPFTDVIYTKQAGQGKPGDILFSSVANCTPPSCVKPTVLTATNVTQTTAVLSWTENTAPTAASKWEVYAVPAGSPPPVNGSAVSGVPPYYIANSNPYTITGLQPGTSYVFYVRAICSNTDQSTWTIITPGAFITKPVNDECDAAINIGVNQDQICSDFRSGNTLGATGSVPTIPTTCSGIADDDVWFSFTATSVNHAINISNVIGGTNDLNHAVYSISGNDCSTLTQLTCNDPDNSLAANLTPGNTYKIRVYSKGNVVGQTATFDICVTTLPPPATNDECATAIDITVNDTSLCENVTTGNIIGATASPLGIGACVGAADDDVWFTFKAKSTRQIIVLQNIFGSTRDLNHAVYSGTCGALTQKYCSTPGSLTSNSTTFVVGQVYYLRVWSNSNVSQVTSFEVCIKPFATCETSAGNICASAADSGIVYPNTTGMGSQSPFACLGNVTNPIFYNLHVSKSGPLLLEIRQSESKTNFPSGVGSPAMRVTFVAWGPFTSTSECDKILYKPSKCNSSTSPNNPTPNSCPDGFVTDCNGDASTIKTIHIPNALAGQYYVIMMTNDIGRPGFIRMTQLNANDPNAGSTACCGVNLGEDATVCGDSAILDAKTNLAVGPSEFTWYYNGTIIPGATGSTYQATSSGKYKAVGICTLNVVSDEINLTLNPSTNANVNFSYPKTAYCKNEAVNPSPILEGAAGTFTATPPGLSINSSTGVIDLANSNPGTYSVINTIAAVGGCPEVVSTPVTVSIGVPADVTIDAGCSLNDFQLVANPVSGSFNPATSTFEWTATNGGTFVPTDKKNTIILHSIGTYKVKVTTADGCASEESITVSDINCTIQKGISPGGKNPSFDLSSLNVKRLEIFNRYGTEVYSLDNYTDQWHGQTNGGKDLPDGTYFYQIHFIDNKVTTGWIFINRKH